ncbi:hypothetical protein [Nocardioides sp. P86]|uniref:hypothetical protein n=1 Tax=Nocardioides sp. P86 TaxID=2939569 RepID=UPI00203C08AE|nr:hypothetical protein [Nocardioides sp. P86]MCM3515236.1 hypothetical protein [Nocardioides sp. P86]
MKLIYAYLTAVFGGALIAIVVLRSREHGLVATLVWIAATVAVSLVAVRRQRARDAGRPSRTDQASDSTGSSTDPR